MAKKEKKNKDKLSAEQRRLANLIPFKPGQSGNPKGTPPSRTNLWRYICEYMEMTPEKLQRVALKSSELTMARRAALVTVQKMGAGEWTRLKEMIERSEGKVPQKTEISGANGEPIKFYRGIEPEKI